MTAKAFHRIRPTANPAKVRQYSKRAFFPSRPVTRPISSGVSIRIDAVKWDMSGAPFPNDQPYLIKRKEDT